MAIYLVTSVSSKSIVRREEYIDTDACDLFTDCTCAQDVELRYNQIWYPQVQQNGTKAIKQRNMILPANADGGCWGVKLIRYDIYDSLDEILKEVANHGKN